MTNIDLARRLKESRESIGLSLAEAAKRLGFPSYQTLSKIEQGLREVKVSELPLFARVYFCDLSYLLGKKEAGATAALLWRNAPSEAKKKEAEGKITHLCRQYHLLETLLGLKEEEEFRLIEVRKSDIRTDADVDGLAEKVVNLLGLGKRPALSVQKILEQDYGVKILYHPLSEFGSAASMIHPEYGAVIVVNSNEAPWRRNYDLAHELFHLITWKIVTPEELEDNTFFRDIEKKAERFASSLLLPAMEVEKEISDRMKAQKGISYSDLVDISRDFGVSTVALVYRLANLRLIEWETAARIAKDKKLTDMDKLIRKEEWGEKPVSERYYTLAIKCLRKGLLSRGKFAEITEIDRSEIDEFIGDRGLMESEGATIEIMAS